MEEVIVGVDTGGTFTDFIYKKDGKWRVLKVLSTPENPAEAILKGLREIGGERRRITHGTTVATNALLERKGAKTAFITNKGFEELLLIGRQDRPFLYSLKVKKPEPLVKRELSFGLDCRVNSRGEVTKEIDRKEVEKLSEVLKEKKVESVAVCFLFSFFNPAHEELVKEILESKGFMVSISSQILPEFREYERASTTTVNAYVMPKMKGYISFIEENLQREDTLRIMQSNGGVISSETAKEQPVRTVLSGPAGGVIGAWELGKLAGFERLITFDMGGTSTDVSLVDSRPQITTSFKISGVPVAVPVIDIHTVGAGGGSIAWIDRGGSLRVGPRSAGASPGPICYGKGGKEITITDANLYLGRLDEDFFLGGKMRLRRELLEEPFSKMASELGLTPVELADGILRVANATMERAVRVISIERGYDPKDFSLFTFGGAGGLHAPFLALSLKIPKVIVPRNPGLLSAFGMVMSDVIKDYSITVMKKEEEANPEELQKHLDRLAQRAISEMEEEGFKPEEITFEPSLDVRFEGQSFEISVPFCKNFVEEFKRKHKKLYGYVHDRRIEVVNCRLRVIGRVEKPEVEEFEVRECSLPNEAILKVKKVFFNEEWIETPVVDREKLPAGCSFEGPAVVVEYSSTTLVPPGFNLKIDRFKNLILEVENG
ncbi:N-methylhydantoinase A [Thermovibrio guaymasensis]|uniref:N-methylhydantoinase A n=1 Tax=Thermovibrio guaymasensis TaxID=240167 RepID=A0A420W648_9BACT|nr:hydantoinase/oxoprolinase family protein [Thermovibrio guaymasensis]RKQ60574.1 N-methylhydantoinase A [Thermovibrio guaymasensis]